MGHCGTTFAGNRHFQPVAWMSADRCVHGTAGDRATIHHCEVLPADGTRLESPDQFATGKLSKRHDQQPAGVFVQAMDNASPWQSRGSRILVQNGVRQRTGWVTRPGMDDQSTRLIDDHNVFILMYY